MRNIAAVCAIANGGVIGCEGKIPWHVREDLRQFRRLTLGHQVVMGRKTCESLPGPLPGRENLVLSANPRFAAPQGFRLFRSWEEVMSFADPQRELMVIGGGSLYKQVMPYLQRQYLSYINIAISGDVFYPMFSLTEWQEREHHDYPGEGDEPSWSFSVLERIVATPKSAQ